MKKTILLSLVLAAITLSGVAQVPQIARVSSNGLTTLYPGTPTYLKKAMNEAQDDDYIYLPGISFNIDSLTFTHRVNVVGAGYYPDSSRYVGRTIISSCNAYLGAGAAGGSLQGVNFNNVKSKHCSNFTVSKCMFNSAQLDDSVSTYFNSSSISYNPDYYTNYNGFLYLNDCIVTSYFSNNNQFADHNCYFTVNATNSILNTDNTSYGGSEFTNCVILNAYYVIFSGSNNVYQNCIIAERGVKLNSTYYNCHFINFSTTALNTLTSGATLVNCTSAVTTLDTFEGGACPINFPISNSYVFDFHVKSTSTAAASGLDNTDKGIYGTTSPYDPTPYPHIYYKVIAPTTDAQGQLQINVKAKAQ